MIYLASRSPRRRVLLRQMKVQFRTLAVDVDEDVNGGEAPASYVIRIARAKASQGWSRRGSMGGIPVLGTDTAVVVSGEILGKPKHHEDAQRMLVSCRIARIGSSPRSRSRTASFPPTHV